MSDFEIRRLVFVMEFFYGFLFGIAIFGATLTFLIVQSFLLAILLSIGVFSFFIFLVMMVRYFIFKIKTTQSRLDALSRSVMLQEKILDLLKDRS